MKESSRLTSQTDNHPFEKKSQNKQHHYLWK